MCEKADRPSNRSLATEFRIGHSACKAASEDTFEEGEEEGGGRKRRRSSKSSKRKASSLGASEIRQR